MNGRPVWRCIVNLILPFAVGFMLLSVVYLFTFTVSFEYLPDDVASAVADRYGVSVVGMEERTSVKTALSVIAVYEAESAENDSQYYLAIYKKSLFYPRYQLEFLAEMPTPDAPIVVTGDDFLLSRKYVASQTQIAEGAVEPNLQGICLLLTCIVCIISWVLSDVVRARRKTK